MAFFELQGVTKYFGGLAALSDLSLFVKKGEILGLIGPNGAGKTTVFNVVTGVFPPSRGKILFKEGNITGLKPYQVARKGLVRTYQLSTFFKDMTVLENIIVGLQQVSGISSHRTLLNPALAKTSEKILLEKADTLLDFMSLMDVRNELAKNLPHGYQRRLGVTIALTTTPEMILLDEPFTGMNAEEASAMSDKIRKIRERDITLILVEHNIRTVKNLCDRIYVLNFGKVIAEGLPDAVLRSREVIEAYLGEGYHANG